MKKVRFALLLTLVAILALTSCIGFAETADAGEGKYADRHVGAVMMGTNNEFFRFIVDSIEAEAKKDGAEFTLFDANFDVAKQIEQLQNAATMGCTDIIIIPVEENSLKDTLKKIRKDYGINVSSFTFAFGGDTDCYDSVSMTPYYEEGIETAEAMKAWADHKYPDAEAGSVKTVLVAANVLEAEMVMDQGVIDGLGADDRFDVLEVIKMDETGDNYTNAQDAFDNIMLKYPDVQCVCFHYANTQAAAADERAMQQFDPNTTDLAIFGISLDMPYVERVASAEEGKSFCRGGGGYDLNAVSKIYHICMGEYDDQKDPVTKQVPFAPVRLTWDNASDFLTGAAN